MWTWQKHESDMEVLEFWKPSTEFEAGVLSLFIVSANSALRFYLG